MRITAWKGDLVNKKSRDITTQKIHGKFPVLWDNRLHKAFLDGQLDYLEWEYDNETDFSDEENEDELIDLWHWYKELSAFDLINLGCLEDLENNFGKRDIDWKIEKGKQFNYFSCNNYLHIVIVAELFDGHEIFVNGATMNDFKYKVSLD